MGLADRLKDLTTKAQDAVVERNEDIHKVVEKVAATADERTGGKYREQIQRAGAKAGGLIDGLKGTETPPATDAQTPSAAQAGRRRLPRPGRRRLLGRRRRPLLGRDDASRRGRDAPSDGGRDAPSDGGRDAPSEEAETPEH